MFTNWQQNLIRYVVGTSIYLVFFISTHETASWYSMNTFFRNFKNSKLRIFSSAVRFSNYKYQEHMCEISAAQFCQKCWTCVRCQIRLWTFFGPYFDYRKLNWHTTCGFRVLPHSHRPHKYCLISMDLHSLNQR